MSKLFITSDPHFGHDRDFLYGDRGYASIEEHDEDIINKWNSVVDEDDTVIILGDLMLNDNEHGIECLKRLNGHIEFLIGNHDTDKRIALYEEAGFFNRGHADIQKYRKYTFYLSHRPTLCSNLDMDKPLTARTINICGHTHTEDCFLDWDAHNDMIFHCELDTNNCYPWLIDDIIEKIKEKVRE